MNIELTTDQASIIADACELLLRIHIGQLKEPFRELLLHTNSEELRNVAGKQLDKLCASPISVHNAPERARVALDIYSVLRHWLAWNKNPEGGFQVWFDEPMSCSAGPQLKIKPALPGNAETRRNKAWLKPS